MSFWKQLFSGLSKPKPPPAESLIKALGDSDNNKRCIAAKALSALGEPKWEEWVKGDDEDFLRLGTSRDPRAVHPLLDALASGDRNTRALAAFALGELADPCAFDPLLKALEDCGHNTESSVASTLKVLGVSDYKGQVRHAAAFSLGKFGNKGAIPPLRQALQDPDNTVRLSAAESLASLGEQCGFDYVIKTLSCGDKFERPEAARALGRLGSPCAIEALSKVMEDQDEYDSALYLAEHNNQPDCIVVQTITRNSPPRDAFTIRFSDRLFELADDVAPVEKTSTNSRPKVTVPDDVVKAAVGACEKAYGDLVKTLRGQGYTEAASKEAVSRCTLAGILSSRKEDGFPKRTLYRQTNGTNQRADQREN